MSRSKKSKRRYTSARERAEKANRWESTSLRLPDGVQLFRPKAGVMLLDILPYEAGEGNPFADPGMLHWERTYYAHRDVGPNGDTYVCPKAVDRDNRCPICEHRFALKKQGDVDEDLIKALGAKERQLFNVINRKEPDKGVQLWDISSFLFGQLLDERLRGADEEDEWDRFFFIEDGLTLRVQFKEENQGGYSYVKATAIDFKPRKRPYDEEILEKTYCLDDLLIVPEYDALQQVFSPEDSEEDEERPPRRPSRKRPAADPDDDFDDEEDEESEPKKLSKKKPDPDEEDDDFDEEEEDPKPSKKKPSKAKDPDPEDEDNWDDFDEEPEDKKPAKSKAKKPAADPDDEDDDFEDEDEESKPSKKKPAKKPAKGKKADEEDDDDDWDDWE